MDREARRSDPEIGHEAVRARMAIPSDRLHLRGQRDGIGFARDATTMAAVWNAAAQPPHPASLGPDPGPEDRPIVGAIAPHDDYLYAGRVCRRALERIEAKIVLVIGVFHAYQRFELPEQLIFDPFWFWHTPDGPVAAADLRNDLIEQILRVAAIDSSIHEYEHSIEAVVYWLKHAHPDVTIVPVLAPAGRLGALEFYARQLSGALVECMRSEGLEFGKDVAIVISADAIHYGADFNETRFGPGGKEAHDEAMAFDRRILTEFLAGEITPRRVEELYNTFVDPNDVHRYQWTWCGRFSIPFGLMVFGITASAFGMRPIGWPLAYETSVSAPPLDVHMPPLGTTAPATFDHFVGYPAVSITFAPLAASGDRP